MEKYLVIDDCTGESYKEDEKGLKELLIEEIKDDTLTHGKDDFEIVEYNFSVMEKLVLGDTITDDLKMELKSFNWSVISLLDLQSLLTSYQAFKHGVGAPSYPQDCIEQTLRMIEEDMK